MKINKELIHFNEGLDLESGSRLDSFDLMIESYGQLNKDKSNAHFKEAMSIMDKLVAKGLIHKNKAARHKSRLNKHIKELA